MGKLLTQSQALAVIFALTIKEIAEKAAVPYQTAVSWKRRWNTGHLSGEKSSQILRRLGYSEVEENRWK